MTTDLVPVEESHVVRLGEARPQSTIELATLMANALTDIVEKKRLFATISGKKFPTVEAWMTIARMDNVVARELQDGVAQLDDGSFEAQVELIRLSDGLVIGRGSAICGTPGDKPWDSRPMPQRRSMAVTRATSRAFRQQYSWIMALAGYEPTPAEEMSEGKVEEPKPATTHRDGLVGIAEVGKARDSDFEIRQAPDGFTLGFRLKGESGGFKVLTHDELALQLVDLKEQVVGSRVTVWGTISTVTPGPNDKWRAFQVIDAEKVAAAGRILPGNVSSFARPIGDEDLTQPHPTTYGDEPEPVPLAAGQESFDLETSMAIDAEEAART